MLEHQCNNQKGEETNPTTSSIPNSPTRIIPNLIGNSLKYIPGAAISQQPMFLASILSALQLVCNNLCNYLYIIFYIIVELFQLCIYTLEEF